MLMPEGTGHLAGDHAAPTGEHGEQEREDLHEVRRVVQEALALVEGLVHEVDLALLQVPEAAVGELRRLGRGARREVVALHESGAQTPRRGIERHPGAGDAGAHHQHVERVVGQAPEGVGPVEPARAAHGRKAERPDRGRAAVVWCGGRCWTMAAILGSSPRFRHGGAR
jgi:hypothetical protein